MADRRDYRLSLAGWLLFALVLHLLLIRQLPTDFRSREQTPATSPSIAVVLKRETLPPRIRPEPVPPEPVIESPVAPAKPVSPVAAEEQAQQSAPTEKVMPQPRTETAAPPTESPGSARVDATRLRDAIRSYRLPEQNEQPFTRMLPPGVAAGAFAENTLARVNRRIHEYDGRGGAEVVRVRRFGQKDRCFLVHRQGFEVEREDWDPGMNTMVGWGAEEIPCE